MAGKGSSFERDMARTFSLWWTGGEHDDVFWRVLGSGGRATRKSRTGKNIAHASFGDLEATDPGAFPFTSLVVVEIKRGYGRWSVCDVLDNPVSKTQPWAKFFEQVSESQRDSGRPWWMVVYKRDKRKTMVALMPELFKWLCKQRDEEADWAKKTPVWSGDLREQPRVQLMTVPCAAAIMGLDAFLKIVPPAVFRAEAKRREKQA